ncbi:threonine synthase [Enemella evansiae]|uniref:threonine synthase n=1 Tax=Enemella evansiae TaxID=2016499 RepID=UPI000B96199C|nr:threonine synthase [Enemella evansiae]OYO12159.1 threonine synthase [Enemella evansiae]
MRYHSTRTPPDQGLQFGDILLAGLAPDGGLYLPERYPDITDRLPGWRTVLAEQGYAAVAAEVLELFVDDIPAEDLRRICRAAYSTDNFATEQIVPVSELGDRRWLAHLSDGPTAAFKDLAMQLLGRLFEYELERRDSSLTILGATSGDTGSAAEYAMRGRDNLEVFMLTPRGRMTPFQQAQMFSLDETNIHNIAVAGVFDDAQDLVKAVNADPEFKARYHIGAVNSINWARLMAQIVYYIVAWLRVTEADDQQVSFCVPTGNFGNICAGHLARQLGLPIDRLLLATNENNVLDEFFRTGVYRVRAAAETHETSSPSMDISKASNFERFVHDLYAGDADRVRELFAEQLPNQGYFDLSGTPEFAGLAERFGFASGSSTHADRLATIKRVWQEHRVLIDPHTADAVKVADELAGPDETVIVLETALPVKFAATIREAVDREPDRPEAFVGIEDLPRHVVDLPNDVPVLKEFIATTLAKGPTPVPDPAP